MTEYLYKATERARTAEEEARVQAANLHSKSGLTGIFTTGSSVPDSELQQQLNQARAQLQEQTKLNQELETAAEASRKELEELRRQLAELRGEQMPIPPVVATPPTREFSPIPEAQEQERTQREEDPVPPAQQRTYTLVQDYQWLITKDYFSDLEERARQMYMYEREVFELSRLIPKEQFPSSILLLNKARLRAKNRKRMG